MQLTADDLRALNIAHPGQIENQVEIFERIWPNGCKVGVHNLRRALKAGLHLLFLFWLRDDPRCTLAWDKYTTSTLLSWNKYEKARASAQGAHDEREKIHIAFDEYEKACDAALIEVVNMIEEESCGVISRRTNSISGLPRE